MKKQICLFMLSVSSWCASGQSVSAGADVTIGKTYSLQSTILNEEREFRVFLPESYKLNSKAAYPVVYLLDGDAYFLSAWSSIQSLAGEGRMPASILVAITSRDRRRDMTPPYMTIPGVSNPNAKNFLAFLADELIPHIDQQYRTKPLRVLVGHSHAALFLLYALTERSTAFKWYLALDAPMNLNDGILARKVHEFIAGNKNTYGKVGVAWNRYSWDATAWEWLTTNSKLITFSAVDLPNETHTSMYHPGIYYGLINLFQDYQKHYTLLTPLADLDQTYTTMKLFYGYDVSASRNELELGAIEHLVAGDVQGAKPYIERLQRDYGTSKSEMGDDFVDWMNALIETPPAVTRSDYLNRPHATPTQLAPFVGTWTDEKQYTISLQVTGDTADGYVARHSPSGLLKANIEKCSVTSDGRLEIAVRNGMTPRSALIIYSLHLQDKTHIEGEMTILAFWPRMQAMTRPSSFVLSKVK